MSYWTDKYWVPEELCATCSHPRNSHLDQPEVKGGPPQSDRGWCALPPGTCIFSPCSCKCFVEPSDELIAERRKADEIRSPALGGGRYRVCPDGEA